MFPYVQNNYKVVEINNVVALRSGHIISQVPLRQAADTVFVLDSEAGWYKKNVVENGAILYIDINGEFKAPAQTNAIVKANQNPILHYTEELFTGPLTTLDQFAVPFENGVAYPRGLVLNIGDVFTTDNFANSYAANKVYGLLNGNGAINNLTAIPATVSGGYVGPLFSLVGTTLPDGETDAYEVTYLGIVQIAATT
jgi:hypothetical protein